MATMRVAGGHNKKRPVVTRCGLSCEDSSTAPFDDPASAGSQKSLRLQLFSHSKETFIFVDLDVRQKNNARLFRI
jgi:hypothetical protein